MSEEVYLKKKNSDVSEKAKKIIGWYAQGVLYRPELSEAVVTDKVTSGLAFEVWDIFASQIRGQMPSSQMKTPEGKRALGFWGVDLLVACGLDVSGTLRWMRKFSLLSREARQGGGPGLRRPPARCHRGAAALVPQGIQPGPQRCPFLQSTLLAPSLRVLLVMKLSLNCSSVSWQNSQNVCSDVRWVQWGSGLRK